jgi:bifunctional DNase/RNase
MVKDEAIEMFVGGLVVDKNTDSPVVILRDEKGEITLPIWIGLAEATSIASALNQIVPSRPLSHDLMHKIITEVGAKLERVVISELRDATFFAELVVSVGERVSFIDARPSDALAIALREAAPIFVHLSVLDQVRETNIPIPIPAKDESDTKGGEETSGPEETIKPHTASDFRAIDKKKWKEILSELDPDDFKYKM